MNKPLLSIVIANYNYGRFLEEAIRSVLSQSCDDYELIIVDGGSTDNSVEVIKKYEDKIAWWVSEKDKGQSDAFNKGFARANGKFLTWLNADDVMLPGVIEKLKYASEKHPKCEWFVGGSLWLDEELNIYKCCPSKKFSVLRAKNGLVSVWGPSSFFTKRLLEDAGGVDERLHYTMDTYLWLNFVGGADDTRVASFAILMCSGIAMVVTYAATLLLFRGISEDEVRLLPMGNKIADILVKKGILAQSAEVEE